MSHGIDDHPDTLGMDQASCKFSAYTSRQNDGTDNSTTLSMIHATMDIDVEEIADRIEELEDSLEQMREHIQNSDMLKIVRKPQNSL